MLTVAMRMRKPTSPSSKMPAPRRAMPKIDSTPLLVARRPRAAGLRRGGRRLGRAVAALGDVGGEVVDAAGEERRPAR